MQILLRSHGFPLEAAGAELLSTEVIEVAAEPEPSSELDYEVDFQVL